MSRFPLEGDDPDGHAGDEDSGGNGDSRLRSLLRSSGRAAEQPAYAVVGTDVTDPGTDPFLPVHGRTAEIATVVSILARRLPPACPILTGSEGTGRKTVAVAALRAVRRGGKDIPPALRGGSARILTMAQLREAPRSDRDVFAQAARDNVLLILDRFEDWVGANTPNPWESNGYSDLLVALLREGLRFVAIASPGLPRLLAGSRNPVAPFLEPVPIGELPTVEMLAAVRMHVPRLAVGHQVRLRGDEVDRAWAAVRQDGHRTMRAVLRRVDRDLAARACGGDQTSLVGPETQATPGHGVTERLEVARLVLRDEFQGQDRAIDSICDLLLHRLGPLAPALRRPRAVVLLMGASGTGKTSMARRLGELLFGPGRVFTLSLGELGPEPQMASYRILGAPAFYPGGLWGTSLCEQVSGEPRCCVILDEFERSFTPYANMTRPPVLDMLFSALGEGRLTDALGNEVHFAETVVFVTSNVRARTEVPPSAPDGPVAPPVDPEDSANHAEDPEARERVAALRALEATPGISVEFLNRVDRVVVFRPLDAVACARLAARLLAEFAERCARAGCVLEWDQGAPAALGACLVDPRYNARFAGRRMEELVEMPVSRLLPAPRVCICLEDGRPVPVVVPDLPENELRLS